MDGNTGRYEFVGRSESILLGICGLYSSVKWHGGFAAGFVTGRNSEMDKIVKAAHFARENRSRNEPLECREK